MSDTSTLFGIKYKGKMIELPKDSSVSWNDLEDKPTTKTFLGYDVYENNINADFPAAAITAAGNYSMLSVDINRNRMEFYVNPGTVYYNGTYTDKHGNTQTLADWQKQFITIVCCKNGVYRTKMIIQPKSDWTYEMILFESLDVEISSIDVNNYSDPTSGSGKYNLRITFTFNSQDYNYSTIQQEILDGYWQVVATDKVYSEKFLPSVIDTSNLVSKSELYDLSTGIVNNYYTKTQIDTSIANNYASKNDISAFITSNDVSTFVTDNDISAFITSNDISAFITSNDVSNKLEANDVSQFLTANDVSTDQPFHFFTNTTDSTKKGIVVKGGDGYAANIGHFSLHLGPTCQATGQAAAAFGNQTNASGNFSFTSGTGVKVYNENEAGFGKYNNSSTGTDTLFTIGNGGNANPNNKHNALEIKLNGDVYIPDTDDTTTTYYYKKPMKRIQDLFVLDTSVSQLWDSSTSGGGGGSTDLTDYYTKTQIDTSIANNYASKNDVSMFAKISYISQSDYDALATKDPSTLYIIPS